MIELFLVVFIIGILLLGQRLSVKYKFMLGIPFVILFMGYIWLDGISPLHLRVLLTVVMSYGLYKHYKTYNSSLSEKNDAAM